MAIKCPNCRFLYVPDLDGDIEKHKEHHARWEELTLPVNCPSLKATGNDLASALLVDHGSPLWKHEHMYRCARAFNDEMRNDFAPWPDPHSEDINLSNPTKEGQLIGDSNGRVFGAACFQVVPDQGYWWLKWVWLAPSERRQGHLETR